jgi:hypothetical protein
MAREGTTVAGIPFAFPAVALDTDRVVEGFDDGAR